MGPEGGPEKPLVDPEAAALGGEEGSGCVGSLTTLETSRLDGVIFRWTVLPVKSEGQGSPL